MDLDATQLPESREELKDLILSLSRQYARDIQAKEQELRSVTNDLLLAQEQIALLRHKIFGRMSEKLSGEDARQAVLFNEAEVTVDADVPEEELEEAAISVVPHRGKKRGRKPLPENLPREERVHDIAEEEKTCGCGAPLVKIGGQTSEELEVVPAQVKVIRHIRLKYACKACEGTERAPGEPVVKIAPVPEKLIPRSISTASLLSFIATGKFVDGLPFSRQEKQFSRIRIDISRQDMSGWMMRAGAACVPLIELMQTDLRAGPAVGADETPFQVHGEPEKENTSSSRMWVFRGGPPGATVLLYQYHQTRSSDIPLLYLSGYQGYLQTDDYSGYDRLAREDAITHVGCWAHARRKFTDAKSSSKKTGSADVALSFIAALYKAEKELREKLDQGELSPDEFVRQRRKRVVPHLRKFRDWYRKKILQVPPSSLLGKALFYLNHEWPKLLRYLQSPFLTPDNNAVERAIRPFVVGRKAWLYAGSPRGAHASAAFYSLIETAKANGIEPYLYLRYIFSRLPFAKTEEDYRKLLPYNIDRKDLALFL